MSYDNNTNHVPANPHIPKRIRVKITGYAALEGASNRWKYAWVEVVRQGDNWVEKEGGRSGTTSERYALNTIEASNTGAGVEGNSIDVEALKEGFELKPVMGDPVVWLHFYCSIDGKISYDFEYINAVDGEC